MTDWLNEIEARAKAHSPVPQGVSILDYVGDAGADRVASDINRISPSALVYLQIIAADVPRLVAEVRKLRAILAPKLAGTSMRSEYKITDFSGAGQYCFWCDAGLNQGWHEPEEHAPDCPVLRRDEILGTGGGA